MKSHKLSNIDLCKNYSNKKSLIKTPNALKIHEIIHTIIREFRIEFLLENYSFQYKISKIMGTIALFNTIYRISTQRTQRDKMRKCEFSLYMSFFTLLSFHLAFKFKVNYFMIQTRCAV